MAKLLRTAIRNTNGLHKIELKTLLTVNKIDIYLISQYPTKQYINPTTALGGSILGPQMENNI